MEPQLNTSWWYEDGYTMGWLLVTGVSGGGFSYRYLGSHASVQMSWWDEWVEEGYLTRLV